MHDKLKDIYDRMYTPTSKNQLNYMLKGKTKILLYDECLLYDNIKDLLAPYGNCIILYPNTDKGSVEDPIGHWICLLVVNGDTIEYFDSYGAEVDSMIIDYNDNSDPTRGELIPPHISKLLSESGCSKMEWNETTFQSDDTSTCGLWCVLRIKCNNYDEAGFKRIAYDIPMSLNVTPDMALSLTILDLFPEMRVGDAHLINLPTTTSAMDLQSNNGNNQQLPDSITPDTIIPQI